jgi:plasmid stabilization system protein ParE
VSLRITYHELARADLYDAWSWYEAREPGLGDRVIRAVDAALNQVSKWPNSGSPTIKVNGEVAERRVGTTGFPYLVRYRIVDDTILVTAIYHHRRHPGYGSDRAL